MLYEKTWLDKETRIFNDHSITKEFGQMPHSPSAYNVMPITSVSYRSHQQLKEDILSEGKKQNLTELELNERLSALDKNAKGGEIQIYISRYEEEQANFKWYFVVIRGEDDKDKLWEHEIGYQAPQNPYERGWWNYTTVKIPGEIKTPFYIYFNDKHSKFLSDFKFKVDASVSQNTTEN
jgi:hypothetical protein